MKKTAIICLALAMSLVLVSCFEEEANDTGTTPTEMVCANFYNVYSSEGMTDGFMDALLQYDATDFAVTEADLLAACVLFFDPVSEDGKKCLVDAENIFDIMSCFDKYQILENLIPEDMLFTCADGEKINAEWECDAEEDCSDGSDEAGCSYFTCDDDLHISEAWVCDNFTDCDDGTDEADCGR